MASKNTRKSSSRPSKSRSKSSTRSNTKKKKDPVETYDNVIRILSVVVLALSVIFFCIAVIKGDGAWKAVHNFYVGIFGKLSACLFPILTIVILIINTSKDYAESRFIPNMVELLIFILLVSSFVHIIINNSGDVFKDAVLNAYSNAPDVFNGGLFGAVIGWLLLTCGKAPAIIIDIVLAFVDFMLMTRITVKQLFKGTVKPVVATQEKINQLVEEKHSRQNQIDIPLDKEGPDGSDDKKKQRPQKKNDEKTDTEDKKKEKKKTPIDPEISATDEIIAELNAKNRKKEEPDNGDAVIDNQDKSETEKEEKAEEKEKSSKKEKENPDAFVVSDEQMKNGVDAYALPSVDLLKDAKHASEEDVSTELKDNAEKLIDTLQSFNVDASVTDISRGPSVTRYELKPAAGIRISKITGLADDIALSLAARQVRIEAPIPGKSAVGIEIPNKEKSGVSIKEIIDTPEFKAQKSKLSAGLGKDITGKPVYCDIARMPHLLIAGTTGSGKSVCMNSIIVSILYRARPDEVKFVMIDPKQVEFSKYAGIPHLLVPVVTNPKKASGALSWAVNEMLERYNKFSETEVKDIESYNRYVKKHDDLQPMPKICIFIDELADLMMAAPKEVEDSICRLAQMARAAGMHLVIATQRPSVDVITGLVKANISSRIALTVSSQIDSRTILDMGGAEKLLGMGDMLYRPIDADKPYRVQGCYVSDEEIEDVCSFIKSQSETSYDEEIQKEIDEKATQQEKGSPKFEEEETENNYDSLFQKAAETVIELGTASTSLLQRKLSVGYARGAKIIDQLEEFGVISKPDGSKPRTVLMTKSMLLEKLAYNSGNGPKISADDMEQLSFDEENDEEDDEED